MNIKILVVSDSHGHLDNLRKAVYLENPFDYIIHCGDGANDLMLVDLAADIKKIRVNGNIDVARGLDYERAMSVSIGKYRLLITHGDSLRVRNGYNSLIEYGKQMKADIILFGHTHKEHLSKGGVILFNPGALIEGKYGLIEIGEDIVFQPKSL